MIVGHTLINIFGFSLLLRDGTEQGCWKLYSSWGGEL